MVGTPHDSQWEQDTAADRGEDPPPPRCALLFPGQGSQTKDMRRLVTANCPELLELAVEEVGEDPFARVEDGTQFAQPAMFCASIAHWAAAGSPDADFYAGHSLGELAALAAGRSLSVKDALRLCVIRGDLMQRAAAAHGGGAMLAIVGPVDAVRDLAAESRLAVANDNSPTQLVLSGSEAAVGGTEAVARSRGLRTVRLPVRGPFHSPAMAEAVPPFREALSEIEIRQPRLPVFSCVTARPFDDIRARLAEALVRPVRWRETLLTLRRAGVVLYLETGPGRVLTGLARQTLAGIEARTLGELEGAHA